MKKSSVIVVAAGIMCAMLSGCGFIFNLGKGKDGSFSVGTFEYSAGEIDRVEVDWSSGSVRLVESEGSSLKVQETDGGLSDAQKMRCKIENRTLKISFCKPGCIGIFPPGTKLLTVEVPKGTEISVNSSSADICMEAETPKTVELYSSSGNIEAGTVYAEKIRINSTSGLIRLEKALSDGDVKISSTSGGIDAEKLYAKGRLSVESTSGSVCVGEIEALENASVKSTSGRVEAKKITAPYFSANTTSGSVFAGISSCEEAEIESTSGTVRVELLDDLGATVTYKAVSGHFEHGDCYLYGEKYIFGNGGCRIRIRTTSGNIKVK